LLESVRPGLDEVCVGSRILFGYCFNGTYSCINALVYEYVLLIRERKEEDGVDIDVLEPEFCQAKVAKDRSKVNEHMVRRTYVELETGRLVAKELFSGACTAYYVATLQYQNAQACLGQIARTG